MLRLRRYPKDFKQLTQGVPIRDMPAPAEMVLPLSQHVGKPCLSKVAVGDKVERGSLIARAQGYLSAPIHASVSGVVKKIESRPHPLLGQCPAIVIATEGREEADSPIQQRENISRLSPDEIREILRNCGIVGLGGAAFPTHVKLNPPKDKPIDSFILNGAECEPYLTADHRLMLEDPEGILAGMKIAMRTLGVSLGFVAIEENKPDAIDVFKRLIDGQQIKLVRLKSFYPQGAERQLIKTVLQREVPAGGLPFDVGAVVNNVATAFSIYEAVHKNKPLYERVITASGKILKNPANLRVRIGTRVKDVLEFCGGFTGEPGKVIMGGPMMGIAQYTLEVPIIKGSTGIVVLSRKEVKGCIDQPCIRCGRCVQICPMGLDPSAIAQAIEKGRYDLAKELNCLDCIECGICGYVCPSNRNVVGLVQLAKQRLKNPKSEFRNSKQCSNDLSPNDQNSKKT